MAKSKRIQLKDYLTVRVMNLTIFGFRKIKDINFMEVYQEMKDKAPQFKTWLDKISDFQQLQTEVMINDFMDVCMKLTWPSSPKHFNQVIFLYEKSNVNLAVAENDMYDEENKLMKNLFKRWMNKTSYSSLLDPVERFATVFEVEQEFEEQKDKDANSDPN